MIVDGVSGLLVSPFDAEKWASAIIRLIDDISFAQKLAANGRNRAFNMFSIERFVLNYEKMYEDVVLSLIHI